MNFQKLVVRLCCLLSLVVLAACGDDDNGPSNRNVSTLLTRSQENPAFTNYSSSGTGTITVTPTGEIRGVIVTNGIIGTEAHIHSGAPGVAGPVEIPLTGGPSIWTIPEGTVLTADQLTKLNAGLLYYNVHSVKAPAGEIRGQLTQTDRFAILSGASETPSNSSSATGTGILAVDPSTAQIRGFVRSTGVTGTAAHIHVGAPGVAGPVIVPLIETAPGSGIWAVPESATLTGSQVASFNAGNLYYNVHSAAFPSGEIRGQLVPATLTMRSAVLSGPQEVPPVASTASGIGVAVLNSVTSEIFGDTRSMGLNGTVAHIHEGAVGVAGPIRVNQDKVLSLLPEEFWTVRDADRIINPSLADAFTAGNLYFNVHSAAFPSGEIRGQINSTPKAFILGK